MIQLSSAHNRMITRFRCVIPHFYIFCRDTYTHTSREYNYYISITGDSTNQLKVREKRERERGGEVPGG